MLSTKTLEQTTYDTVCLSSFTKIHGRPICSDYKNVMKIASDLASKLDDITYAWSRSPTREEYRLLAKIIGEDKYCHLTNLTWTQEVEPAMYAQSITSQQRIPGNTWNRNGSAHTKCGP
jgi:hypothetical protein